MIALILGTAGVLYQRRRTATPTPVPAPLAQAASPTPPTGIGGDYTEGDIGLPQTLDPLLAGSPSERDLREVLFDGLTRVDGSGTVSPDLAEQWSASDDGLSYTFTLRAGVRWHDGAPFSAQDVRFTIGLVQDPDFPGDQSLARFWRGIVVETPDDTTVIFHLHEPFAAFPSYTTLPIVPKHLLGGVLARDLASSSFDGAPVGTGPFALARFDPAHSQLELRANPTYFRQQPHLASLTFHYYRDSDAVLSALSAGDIQGTGSLPVTTVLRPGALPGGLTAYAPLLSGYTALYFNLRVAPFTSVDVRRAIDLAVDRESLIHDVLPNQAVVGDGPIPVASWAYAAQPRQPDVSAAQQQLDAAGWSDSDGDGVLDKGSTSLSFPLLVNGDDPQRLALATEISRQLAAIKIQAQVQALSTGDVAQALMSHQFTAAIFGWESPTGDPDCYQTWHSSQSDNGLNFSGLNDPKIDKLLEDARQASGNDRRAKLYAQFQQAFADDVPALILYYPRYFFVVSNKVHGITVQPIVDPSQRLADVSSWFMVGVPLTPVSTPERTPAG